MAIARNDTPRINVSGLAFMFMMATQLATSSKGVNTMPAGILVEYRHAGRAVQVPFNGPITDAEFEDVKFYYTWLWGLLKKGGLASYSYRMAHTRWHMASGGSKVKGIFEEARETREFFARYSKPKIFLAVNPDLVASMRKEVGTGAPHSLEVVTEKNGLENMRLYSYVQLGGTTPKGTRVHTWWPDHVYFDYRKFLADKKNWTIDCSVEREKSLNKNTKKGRRGNF